MLVTVLPGTSETVKSQLREPYLLLLQMVHQKLGEGASSPQQLLVAPGLRDEAVLQDDDAVDERQDGDRVGDQDSSLVPEEAVATEHVVEDVLAWGPE